MLPVFTIVFFGVMYVKDATVAAHEGLAHARYCAWKHSKEGCQDAVPAGCEAKENQFIGNTPDTLFRGPSAGGEDVESEDSFALAKKKMNEEMDSLGGGDLVTELKDAVVDVVMKVAEAFANKRTNLYSSRKVTPAKILGPERTIGMSYRMACNTQKQTIGDVFEKLFEPISPF